MDEAASGPVAPAAPPRQRGTVLLVGAVTALMAVRFFHFLDRFAVDVLFWDQWDFWVPVFEGAGPWTLFRWQHGPHRQGLGGWVIAAVARLSSGNVRAEVFVSGAIVLASAIAALALVRAARGRWALSDAIVPVIVLTLSQADLVLTPNPAHGPLPLLLALLFAWGCFVRRDGGRAVLLGAISVAASHTAFGLFLPLVTIPVLVLMTADAIRRRTAIAAHALALAAASASLWLMFSRYTFYAAADCFRFPDPEPRRYLDFLGFTAIRLLELERRTLVAPWLGVAFVVLCVAITSWSGWITARTLGEDRRPTAVFVLSAFTLLFTFDNAAGRACLGVEGGATSRYVPYVVPLVLAVHLALTGNGAPVRRPSGVRSALVLLFCIAIAAKEVRAGAIARIEAGYFKRAKLTFRDCYLATHDVEGCNARATVYPYPVLTHMSEKLRWLEEHRWSFFRRR